MLAALSSLHADGFCQNSNPTHADWQPWSQKLQAPPPLAKSKVSEDDILAVASAIYIFPQRNVGIHCLDADATLADLKDKRVVAIDAAGAKSQRFGEVLRNGTRSLELHLNAYDIVSSGGSQRCEIVFYPSRGSAIPEAATFWFSVKFRTNDWSGSKDEQIIAQMQTVDRQKVGLNPFFALVAKGDRLRAEIRWNSEEEPTKANTRLTQFSEHLLPSNIWNNITVKGFILPGSRESSEMKVWLNDEMIVDHNAPVGYRAVQPNQHFVKFGIYHWAANNPWDLSVPDRQMTIGSMLLVLDRDKKYSQQSISRLANALMRQE